jgi:hypothetical protein
VGPYVADHAVKFCGEQEIAALLSVASQEIKLVLALWTGQRQGDLLRLPWSSTTVPIFGFRQSKTGRRMAMAAGRWPKRRREARKANKPVEWAVKRGWFSRRLNRQILEKLGGRTRARTWDPMIKSPDDHQVYQWLECKLE